MFSDVFSTDLDVEGLWFGGSTHRLVLRDPLSLARARWRLGGLVSPTANWWKQAICSGCSRETARESGFSLRMCHFNA